MHLSLFCFVALLCFTTPLCYAVDPPKAVVTTTPVTPVVPSGSSASPAAESIHQFDRYLLVFHFQESTEFDEVGNLVKQEYKFGNRSIDINPTYLTNQHTNTGTIRGRGGVDQVIVLETPINEISEASINFLEATSGGINCVTIYEIAEKKNVFRCFYTRMINTTDHKEKKSKQQIIINEGLAYPVNKEGEPLS